MLFDLFGGGHVGSQRLSIDQAVAYLRAADKAAVLSRRRSEVSRLSEASRARCNLDNVTCANIKRSGSLQPDSQSSGSLVISSEAMELFIVLAG